VPNKSMQSTAYSALVPQSRQVAPSGTMPCGAEDVDWARGDARGGCRPRINREPPCGLRPILERPFPL
jgi:hypothetical protein